MIRCILIAVGLTITFKSEFGDRFMYRHSMKAPDEMRELHRKFYGCIKTGLKKRSEENVLKTVKKTSIFPASKKKVFDKLLKLRTLQYIALGLYRIMIL